MTRTAQLVHETTGKPVSIGETLTSFRGEPYLLTAIREPHKPGSTGRVVVRKGEHTSEFFPGVFGLVWKPGHRDEDWTAEDCWRACDEGWCLFDCDGRGVREIQRDDEAGIFADDAEAIGHVMRRAREGSWLHRRALRIDRQAHPNSYPVPFPWEEA